MRYFSFAFFLAASASFAFADTVTSVYSDFSIDKCNALQLFEGGGEDEGGEWECGGIKGHGVMYWEGDLRGFIAFGPEARSQCSSAQTFGAFNSPGTKVEWRMEGAKPFATILRWFTDNGSGGIEAKQNWLVVTKLNGKDACRTALIDTKHPDANRVARELADDASRRFNCEKDMPQIVSRRAIKAEEVMSGAPCPGGPYREE